MELSDVLLIAGSGITVVFLGLILTSLMIYSFALVSKLLEQRKAKQASTDNAEFIQPQATEDVAAVIAAVLEIERRLLFSDQQEKLTFTGRKTASSVIE